MYERKDSVIIKLDYPSEQTVGEVRKFAGLIKAKALIPVIDNLDLEANPRSSRTGPVTDAIEESIDRDPALFPFKTKGLLLACSQYERMERNRVKLTPHNREIEGILDGGHNTLAIGLHILGCAMSNGGLALPLGTKTWDTFKQLWHKNRAVLDDYLEYLKEHEDDKSLEFYVPVEILLPRDTDDPACVEAFRNNLLEISAARNNNVQLQLSARANQLGYFDELKRLFAEHRPEIGKRIEWKSNDGGQVKVQDVVALAWIPLSLVTTVRDEAGKQIVPISASGLYSRKSACLQQFEWLMSSPEVMSEPDTDYKRRLLNAEVASAFKITVDLPELYDYIYESFPSLYDAAVGGFDSITAVRQLNEKQAEKCAPYSGKPLPILSPDGYIAPLMYGLQALMEKRETDGKPEITWRRPPRPFLEEHLEKIVKHYSGILSMCDFDPQKIGKSQQSYEQALAAFKMALAGIL